MSIITRNQKLIKFNNQNKRSVTNEKRSNNVKYYVIPNLNIWGSRSALADNLRTLIRLTMKRLQESSPSSGEIPKLKKVKTNDPPMTTPTEDGGWTKVEKRKQKKAKKVEVKLDVCVFSFQKFRVRRS